MLLVCLGKTGFVSLAADLAEGIVLSFEEIQEGDGSSSCCLCFAVVHRKEEQRGRQRKCTGEEVRSGEERTGA